MYEVRRISMEEKEKLLPKIYSKPLFESKANIYGACVKFFTDSPEQKEMWEDNFHPMLDSIRPHARVISVQNGKDMRVSYEPVSKTVIIENCSYYGWVKSIALGVVAEFLEDVRSEHRRYSIHGSYVDFGGNGIAIIGPSGSGKTTLTYGLMLEKYTNFLTDDWMFVRLANDVLVTSSEKNSYVRDNLEKDWKQYSRLLKPCKGRKDKAGRSILDVRMLFGEERLFSRSVMGAAVILANDKKKPAFEELEPDEAAKYMEKNDFCNPHQLVRNRKKNWLRKKFFSVLFEQVPVYRLNIAGESPRESVERILGIIEEE
ncbi:hypothetical protein GF412_04050 [Candidatus Micrarchaeota archaeon]|nr:hypothetical protein [Candidatus Micrarchaeota archaeon]MBD3418122.1 hypothetical protein [Candidatus Micrarchaeota archaeon]